MGFLKLHLAVLQADLATYNSPKGPVPWRFPRAYQLFGFKENDSRYPATGLKNHLTLDNADVLAVLPGAGEERKASYQALMDYLEEFEKNLGKKADELSAIGQPKRGKKATASPYEEGARLFSSYFAKIWERGENLERIRQAAGECNAMPHQLAAARDFHWPFKEGERVSVKTANDKHGAEIAVLLFGPCKTSGDELDKHTREIMRAILARLWDTELSKAVRQYEKFKAAEKARNKALHIVEAMAELLDKGEAPVDAEKTGALQKLMQEQQKCMTWNRANLVGEPLEDAEKEDLQIQLLYEDLHDT